MSARKVSRGVQIARVIMLAVAGVLLLYIVAANVALRAGLFEGVANTAPEELEISWDRAWTILPGRIHVRGFKLRHQDNNVQQLISIERATLQVKLFPLINKRFHASSVEATGTSYRFRHKVSLATVEENRARLASFPPIAGFPDPAIRTVPSPPSNPDDLWKIELDDVHAQVDELWFMEYRYVGNAHVTGGFRLLPAQRVIVFPTELALEPAPLTFGESRPVMDDFRGRIAVRVDDFDVDLDAGFDVFRHISTGGWLRGTIPGLAFVGAYLDPGTLLADGDGPFEAVWGLDHGRFLLGTRIAYHTDRARLVTRPFEFRTAVHVEVAVEPSLNGPALALRLTSPRLEIDGTGRRSEIRAAVVKGTDVWLASDSVDVTETWSVERARFAVESISVPDLRLMNAVTADSNILAKKGTMTGKAHADMDGEGRLKGRIEAELKDAEVTVDNRLTLAASATLSGRIFQPRASRGRGRFDDVELVMSSLSVTSGKAGSGLGWLRLDEGTILYDHGSLEGIRGKVGVFMPKAEPFLAAIGADISSMPKLAKAVVSTDNLRATVKIRHDAATTDVEVQQARVDGAVAQGRFRRQGKQSAGAFLVRTKLLGVGVKLHNGESDVKMFVGRGWLAEQLRALGFANGG